MSAYTQNFNDSQYLSYDSGSNKTKTERDPV